MAPSYDNSSKETETHHQLSWNRGFDLITIKAKVTETWTILIKVIIKCTRWTDVRAVHTYENDRIYLTDKVTNMLVQNIQTLRQFPCYLVSQKLKWCFVYEGNWFQTGFQRNQSL